MSSCASGATRSHEEKNYPMHDTDILTQIARPPVEVRVRVHLAKADTRHRFQKLEKRKWSHLQRKLNSVQEEEVIWKRTLHQSLSSV